MQYAGQTFDQWVELWLSATGIKLIWPDEWLIAWLHRCNETEKKFSSLKQRVLNNITTITLIA